MNTISNISVSSNPHNTFLDIGMAPRFFGLVEFVGLRSLAQREDSSTILQTELVPSFPTENLVIMFENHVGSERPPFSSSVAPALRRSESTTALSHQRNSAALEERTSATSGGQPNSGATSELLSHDEGHRNLAKT